MLLRAQFCNRAAAQREVHARLDCKRVVCKGEALELRDEAARVWGAVAGRRRRRRGAVDNTGCCCLLTHACGMLLCGAARRAAAPLT